MFRWMTGKDRLWKLARELRGRIRSARPAPSSPRSSVPSFRDLLAEAIRLRDAGLAYEVAVTPELHGEAQWVYRPERVRLSPSEKHPKPTPLAIH